MSDGIKYWLIFATVLLIKLQVNLWFYLFS